MERGAKKPDLPVMQSKLVSCNPLLVLNLLLQPLILRRQLLLVLPVCCKTIFCNVVHLVRANLHLYRLPSLAVYCLVQALVSISLLLLLDVIFVPIGYTVVHLLYTAHGLIALVLVGHHHPERCHIVHLVHVCDAACLHLAPHSIQALGTATDVLIGQAACIKLLLDTRNCGFQRSWILPGSHGMLHACMLLWVQDCKSQIFKLCLEAPHSQSVGHHAEHIKGLPCK
mmetsp:Transcript_19384/g.33487  ORF Transcript_19384/g.33487 Transcript_19384/m.33487 type:complete len:227 (-) Transcript_19384:1134-1814(-)